MIDQQARPLATLDEARDRRRATLEPWLCDGTLKDGPKRGQPCRKTLMELDWQRPSFIKKTCERCGHSNTFVESYRPASS